MVVIPMTNVDGVFISFRRGEDRDARLLYDGLVQHLGQARVFMDVDEIRPGEDWIEAISHAIAKCDVMLVLIGDRWGQVRGESIGDTHNPVRNEIEAALDQGIPIIPVLLQDAVMPRDADLPDTLVRLSYLQPMRLRHETLESDIARLVTVVQKVRTRTEPKDRSRRAVEALVSRIRTW
jgi:hypothetical protein